MSETFIGILGALTALGLLVGIAYVLDRKRKAQNKESNNETEECSMLQWDFFWAVCFSLQAERFTVQIRLRLSV